MESKYEEYLGIRPTNDVEGILQDVHWSECKLWLFSLLCIGYMYAAQLLHSLQQEIDVEMF